MNMAVFMARRDDVLREINSDEWRARNQQALERRVRRAAWRAALRQRVALALRHRSSATTEVREVMKIAKAH
jgi:hypothetical protein